MDKHITGVRQACHYHPRNIAHIRRFLTPFAVKTLVHALVTSRIDYANGLLYGLPKKLIGQLQLVQNMAARIITRTSRRSHITPILKELHWLPVEQRIKYKVLTLTYKAINKSSPDYIRELITIRSPSRSLRSSTELRLSTPRFRTKSFGHRSFQYAAPCEWNNLPRELRDCDIYSTFQRHLKTFLFRSFYE